MSDHHARRAEHIDLLKRALDLETLDSRSREAFENMLEEMSTELPARCAHAAPIYKRSFLSDAQERWVRKVLGEEQPETSVRLTAGDVPRGREVAPMWDAKNLPTKPPGRT